MKKTMLTRNSAEKLREELTWLKQEEHLRAIEAIADARESPDFQNSTAYLQAVERRQLIELRIDELQSKLSNAQVIDVETMPADSRVVFGALVTLQTDSKGEPVCYRIVGEDEADISTGKLSVSAPLGRALLGREEHEQITVETPGGTRTYRILEIRYGL
ncbi:MAG: transcription elongation factor GreA [Granulosicoccaceae bacterium]|jgi:transcription elongation factor GreA